MRFTTLINDGMLIFVRFLVDLFLGFSITVIWNGKQVDLMKNAISIDFHP